MGHGMMEGPGTHHGHGMWHGMPSGHGMHPSHGMHHDMKMGPGMHQGMKMDPGVGQDRGLGPRMLYGWPGGEAQDVSVAGARGWLERKLDWHGKPPSVQGLTSSLQPSASRVSAWQPSSSAPCA
jgi:hypothetical protein